MALKVFRPLTPSLRFTELNGFEELTKGNAPVRKLTERLKKTGGRNNRGRLTSRHIGGGHKQRYRFIDFKRNKHAIPAKVESIEYDPNRTARIALLKYNDGEQRYILTSSRRSAWKSAPSWPAAPRPSRRSATRCRWRKSPSAPPSTTSSLCPAAAPRFAAPRAARRPSCRSTPATRRCACPPARSARSSPSATPRSARVGNIEHENISLGKAGRSRWLGRRPHVRGMVMNPVDHPMGGGQGKSKGGGGRQHPVSPWGQPAKGLKTRPKYKPSNKFIVERRKNKKH